MNEKLDNKLYKSFPNLYADRHGVSMQETAMFWGFETNSGWYPLIFELSKKLEKLINDLPEDQREHYKASQLKEKYGGLRLYLIGSTKKMNDLIYEAENKSYKICDVCGLKGKPNNDGWISTRCKKHVDYRGEDKIHWTVMLKHYVKNWRYYV